MTNVDTDGAADTLPLDARPLFLGLCDRIEVGSDRPIELAGDDVWLVDAGAIDVFAVPRTNGVLRGPRTHLFRVQPGRALFGLGAALASAPYGLLAIGAMGTTLLRAPQGLLKALVRDPRHAEQTCALLECWIEDLYAGMAREVVPKNCTDLEPGSDIDIPIDTAARPRRDVSWIRHIAGHSFLFGKDELQINGAAFVPLARRAWVKAHEPARLALRQTSEIEDVEERWRGLAHLHALILQYVVLRIAQERDEERARFQRRTAADQAALVEACDRLAATMDPTDAPGHTPRPRIRTRDSAAATPRDALLAACRIVARASGVPFHVEARTIETMASPNQLAAILRAARLRARRVALRDDWWKHDQGPLLAYVDDTHAVALVREKRRGYRLHDPSTGADELLTAERAATLNPFAYAFYRPFPDAALSVKDVLRFGVRGCRNDMTMILSMGVAGALLGMVPSIATGVLFNTVIPGAQRSQLLQMTIILLVCAVATAMFTVARGIALLRLEGNMGSAVQAAVWDRLLGLPLPFFRPYAAGDLATRAMSIEAIRQLISGSTTTAIMGGIFSIFNFALMFWYSTAMAWRASVLIAGALAITTLGGYLQLRPQRGIMALQVKTSGLVLQLLTSISKLRSAGAEPKAFSLWAAQFGEQRRLQYKVRQIGNWITAFNSAFPVAANLVIFWIALPLIASATSGVRTGDFLAFLSAFSAGSTALLSTCLAVLAVLNTVPLYEQAKPILTTLPEVDTAKADPGVLVGDIEVQHATFRYRADGPAVLHDLSFHITPGEFAAFVGPTGSGKSTILRLMLGFEQLESGAIYFDGREISGLDVQAVRRQIGAVLQTGRLMSGDIFTNIVGSASGTMEQAWDAARMAGFADDIEALPMGMHTVISEGGGTLSGGQRQRLLIARAIVQRPRIILFDEATSALDNRTQRTVSASLERLQATRIVIAHRLSTIANADRIFVIQAGRLIQTGSYDELMSRPGLFAQLAKRQVV